MAIRRMQSKARPDWLRDEAAGTGAPGFRSIVTPGPQAAPGDETILGPETFTARGENVEVGALAGGGHLLFFQDLATGNLVLRAFDAAGTLLWTAFPDRPDTGSYLPGGVAQLGDGSIAVIWSANAGAGFGRDVFMQRYTDTGTEIDAAGARINSLTTGAQSLPNLALLTNGGLVVAWGGQSDGETQEISAQLFDSAGAPSGANFQLNATYPGLENFPVLDALPDGGFVATWLKQPTAADPIQLVAQRFSAAGAPAGPEVPVTQAPDGLVDIAALSDGGFVVVWADNVELSSDAGSGGQVYARRYGPDSQPYPEGTILVTSTGTGRIGHLSFGGAVSVAGLDSNHFVVTWVDARPAVSTVFGRVYNAVGQSTSGTFVANQFTTKEHYLTDGAIAVVSNDTVMLGWEGWYGSPNPARSAMFRRFAIEVPDPIAGTANGETLNGTALSDLIQGLGGNDVLNGGGSADWMVGGLGDDYFYVDNAADVAVERPGEGNDRVFAGVSYAIAAGMAVEMLTTTNNAATTAINLTGNEIANAIYGNAGANSLDGRAGADTLAGLRGDDFYYVDNVGDRVVETAGEGNDRVFASISYTLGAGVSVEMLTTTNNAGLLALNLTGNELANVIYGNDGANSLNGGGGADTLVGRLGDDLYYVDNAADRVVESVAQGADRVFASVSYTLAAGASVETLTTVNRGDLTALNLSGNEIANVITGNDGANLLDGKGGADTLIGLLGDDLYYIDNAGDRVVEAASQGNDRVLASVSYTLGVGVSVETFTTNNNTATTALNLTGNEFANTIYGNDGANVLDGKGGADTLVGRAGSDGFAFTTALGGGNVDRILDFVSGSDTIRLDDAIFTELGPVGALNPNAFVTGAAAADPNDRIVYNQATGQLFYDADGNGAGAAILFATLTGNPALTVASFQVI